MNRISYFKKTCMAFFLVTPTSALYSQEPISNSILCGDNDPDKNHLGISLIKRNFQISTNVDGFEILYVYYNKTTLVSRDYPYTDGVNGFRVVSCVTPCTVELPYGNDYVILSVYDGYSLYPTGEAPNWKQQGFLRAPRIEPQIFSLDVVEASSNHENRFGEFSGNICSNEILIRETRSNAQRRNELRN